MARGRGSSNGGGPSRSGPSSRGGRGRGGYNGGGGGSGSSGSRISSNPNKFPPLEGPLRTKEQITQEYEGLGIRLKPEHSANPKSPLANYMGQVPVLFEHETGSYEGKVIVR